MEDAPLYNDIAKGPGTARGVWLRASDGVRIRIGIWGADAAPNGTVLLFPGRTEYVEKYGLTAVDFLARGFATVSVDWRGQGVADRALANTAVGHVDEFDDFQKDVAAVMDAARQLKLPRPWYMIGHSMGGAIGLRALERGLDVRAAAFSAPMWGIRISQLLRPIAWAVSWSSRKMAFGHRFAPGTEATTYVVSSPFEGNTLTTDEAHFNYMKDQLTAHPELALGGPSMHWLYEALIETRKLRAMPAPDVPTLTGLGTDEQIVDPGSVKDRMANWPKGTLKIYDGAQHELLMERDEVRSDFIDRVAAHFKAHA